MYRRNKNPIFELQKNTKNIRNFCILAHVDHGKTTLADTLLVSNGIISTRMSGKLKYMDSRKDEQERGITMKSSAISLLHLKNNENYVINLIDSPGHVDFSTEVSTAVRLCDGALILIDVCDGICPQTHAVLRQASLENLKLILVLNKIDRLIVELKMTPLEAYNHLSNILGQFNALVAQQFASLLCEKNNNFDEHGSDETVDWDDNVDDSKLYFSPKYNNVFFSSSLDGWGFSINNFADIYSKKLGFKHSTLLQTLWGDYYLNAKTKRIMKEAQMNGKKPLFVQFVLENIWQIYDAVYTRRDPMMTEKILTALNLKISARDLKYTEPKAPLQALFINWLPLGRNLLDMIVEILPSPLEMTSDKVERLICSKMKPFKSLPKETQNLKEAFLKCDSDPSKPVIVFISKMFAIEKELLSKRQLTIEDIALKREAIRAKKLEEATKSKDENSTKTSQEVASTKNKIEEKTETEAEKVEESDKNYEFLAFARIYSGTLKKGHKLFILTPKHNPEDFVGKDVNIDLPMSEELSKHVTVFTVNDIYLMMGREYQLTDETPSGNIVAIGGLENLILKSATLSSTIFCPSFAGMHLQTSPIVRVAIEPKNPSKMNELVKGLKLLNQSDPCVEVMVQENGEHILCTAGEVHLQRCIDDLVQRYAQIEVNVSPPRIPFKETIVLPSKSDMSKEKSKQDQSSPISHSSNQESEQHPSTDSVKDQGFSVSSDGRVEMQSIDKRLSLSIRARPLPFEVTRYLEENAQLLKLLNKFNQNKIKIDQADTLSLLVEFKNNLKSKFDSANQEDQNKEFNWSKVIDKIITFGPNRIGPNILVNFLNDETSNSVWSALDNTSILSNLAHLDISSNKSLNSPLRGFENSITFGFNLATSKGPICEEPMQGVAFFIENFHIEDKEEPNNNEIDMIEQAVDNKTQVNKEETSQILEEEVNDNMSEISFNSEASKKEKTTKKNKDTNSIEKSDKKTKTQLSSSQCISLIKDACIKAFEAQPQRLMAAMYKCEIMTVNCEVLGKLYAVLGKRNGKILDESLKEGTSMFTVLAHIPVAESFGLAEEIRKRTSGLAMPHIEFSHFEIIEIDPYWEPKTEEELELFGDKADFENLAKKYMNEVRKRKGLFVREKLVEHSEKQRTLTTK